MKPIMLKRHYVASLRGWLGAGEHILYEGNEKVILCEKGVSVAHTHRVTSRYLLDLQVVPAAQEITYLPAAIDPSPATFWSYWVRPMALAGVAAVANGVMLEVYPDPKNSALDPLQPINFKEFRKLMTGIKKISKALTR